MSFVRFAMLLLCVALAGCQPVSQRTGDEQKEPYFLAAKKRMQERDLQGAIEYFEKALDVNPRSASAHIELGILFEQQQGDWPGALYHYSRALQLRPDYASADVIKQHIEYCKRELAKSVVQLPSVEVLQRKVDALAAENQQLKQQLLAWQNYYRSNAVAQPVAPSPVPAPALVASNPPPRVGATPAAEPRHSNVILTPRAAASAPGGRMHTVTGGETVEKIARRYGVKVNAVLSANPSVDPRKLRPGHTLIIPPAAP